MVQAVCKLRSDFQVQIEADLPAVNADCDALVTALLNLLDNAYKYSEEIKHIVCAPRRR